MRTRHLQNCCGVISSCDIFARWGICALLAACGESRSDPSGSPANGKDDDDVASESDDGDTVPADVVDIWNDENKFIPGGFIETAGSTAIRPRLTQGELVSLLPAAGGTFTFPAPYGTEAVRITDEGSCAGGTDCVRAVGYSYWRNINNHAGQRTMLIFVGLDMDNGGDGLSLFRYHKDTGELEALGPVFAGTDINLNLTGEGIYWSGTIPTTLYFAQGAKLKRFDVSDKTVEVVFDAAPIYGGDKYIWQHHSSDDDLVHSATLRDESSGDSLGCLVYREDTDEFQHIEAQGDFDECQVDRSGEWVIIKENIDDENGEDNRIVNTITGLEVDLLDEEGAGGHSDTGYGLMVAEDNWNDEPGAVRLWDLAGDLSDAPIIYHEPEWRDDGSSHITHTNAQPGLTPDTEMVCHSTVARGEYPRGSEIFCYRLDGSLDVMVVAPVMTDLDADGGGDDYVKSPKGNIDVMGRYFIWTSNCGSDRLDAFLVKVPSLLVPAP